jgi:hypothetical protein
MNSNDIRYSQGKTDEQIAVDVITQQGHTFVAATRQQDYSGIDGFMLRDVDDWVEQTPIQIKVVRKAIETGRIAIEAEVLDKVRGWELSHLYEMSIQAGLHLIVVVPTLIRDGAIYKAAVYTFDATVTSAYLVQWYEYLKLWADEEGIAEAAKLGIRYQPTLSEHTKQGQKAIGHRHLDARLIMVDVNTLTLLPGFMRIDKWVSKPVKRDRT